MPNQPRNNFNGIVINQLTLKIGIVTLGYLLRHSREGEIVGLLADDFEVVTRATFGGAAASTAAWRTSPSA